MHRLAVISMVVLSGCANDLRVDHPFDGQTTDGPLVRAEVLDTGGKKLFVDATSKGSQVYVDLDEGREMKADEAFSTNGWDVAFKRYEIAVNSGDQGPTGTVEIAIVKNGDYDGFTQAPADGFAPGEGPAMSVIDGPDAWFQYNLSAHGVVTRTDIFYVVKSSAGAFFKLRMLSYYDEHGTPASITLEYAPVQAP
ncbi:MAG: HmuY family protein [Archangium sp.]